MSINQQQFNNMHEQYRDRLLNSMTAFASNREEAEDITATALARAFEKRDAFRGESSLYTWVHAIALNEARTRRSQQLAVSLDSVSESCSQELTEPDVLIQTLERSECCSNIRAALRRVPTTYRQVLIDRFVRGQSVKQMAKCYRIPLGTVLSRIFRAKRMLRGAWEA
jgi:RNA polymerase sigma-70 factor (ECF subfamily)